MELTIIDNIFKYRHDFVSEDLDLLKQKYNNIEFKNIPEAWVVILDRFLEKHNKIVKCIQQYFGHLSIVYSCDIDLNVKKDQEKTEKRLQKIDMDLFV